MTSTPIALAAGLLATLAPLASQAEMLQLRVTVQNLAPADSISFAPLHVGFHGGTFDAFDAGAAATAPIVSVAEGGSGSAWFPAFAAADPGATLGSVLPDPPGPLLPGLSGQATFRIDTAVNPFFTFAAMVVPSNDYFVGNDDPRAYRLFGADGRLLLESIDLFAADIWDAGSEADDPAHAAFIVGGNNDLRTPQNGVVGFDFEGLSIFNGLTTAAGYVFQNRLAGDTPVYRVDFQVARVPEPDAYWMMLAGLGLLLAARATRAAPAARRG
jgi:hypothetical protein